MYNTANKNTPYLSRYKSRITFTNFFFHNYAKQIFLYQFIREIINKDSIFITFFNANIVYINGVSEVLVD